MREDDAGLGGRRPDSRSRRGGHDQDERARKLAAMQEAASDLDRDRERRLAAFEEAERAAKDSDARARERDRKYGGADRQFASNLHRRAGEMRAADRIRSGRQGADQAGDNED